MREAINNFSTILFSVGNVLSIFLLLLIPKELRHALYFG